MDRLKAYALPALAESLARLDRPELLAHLPRIVASGMTSRSLAVRVLDITAADPSRRKEGSDAFLGLPVSAQELRLAMVSRSEPISDDLAATFEKMLDVAKTGRRRESAMPATNLAPVRMTPSFVPGLWRELAALYRCDVARPRVLAADVRYTPDGRPRRVTPVPSDEDGCTAVTAVLASLSVFAEARPAPADLVETQIVPWQKVAAACDDQAANWMRAAHVFVQSGASTTAPAILEWVSPPAPASLKGEPAKVTLDVLLSAAGCPRELSVRQPGKHTLIDAAAILAVAQWRFRPASVDAQPVNMWVEVEVDVKP